MSVTKYVQKCPWNRTANNKNSSFELKGLNHKLRHRKAQKMILCGRYGDPYGRARDWCRIWESWHVCTLVPKMLEIAFVGISKFSRVAHPASRVSLSLALFWCSRERLCMNWVRSLLSMHALLLGYSFEPRPNSRVLATVSSVMTIGLSMKGLWHSEQPGWRERTRLPSIEVWAAATLKAWRDSDRAYLLPSLHNTQEDSKRLCSEDDTLRLP